MELRARLSEPVQCPRCKARLGHLVPGDYTCPQCSSALRVPARLVRLSVKVPPALEVRGRGSILAWLRARGVGVIGPEDS